MSVIDDIKKKLSGAVSAAIAEDHQKRMDTCKSCDELNKTLMTCRQCGCFMVAKTKLRGASCPLEKW